MSEAQEIAMGKEADPQIVAQYGLYEDSVLQRFIRAKGQAMAVISHRPNINYEFKILDSEVLNAFATPGGYVYFTRGIMAYMNNEAEFAGVLGHELGHIAARHGVEQQRNAMLGQIGLIAGIIVAPNLARFAESASQGLGLLLLKFGRDAEREADKLGVEYSSKIGYDATKMAEFFHTLERQGEQTGHVRRHEESTPVVVDDRGAEQVPVERGEAQRHVGEQPRQRAVRAVGQPVAGRGDGSERRAAGHDEHQDGLQAVPDRKDREAGGGRPGRGGQEFAQRAGRVGQEVGEGGHQRAPIGVQTDPHVGDEEWSGQQHDSTGDDGPAAHARSLRRR